jgi:hypothetical protein
MPDKMHSIPERFGRHFPTSGFVRDAERTETGGTGDGSGSGSALEDEAAEDESGATDRELAFKSRNTIDDPLPASHIAVVQEMKQSDDLRTQIQRHEVEIEEHISPKSKSASLIEEQRRRKYVEAYYDNVYLSEVIDLLKKSIATIDSDVKSWTTIKPRRHGGDFRILIGNQSFDVQVCKLRFRKVFFWKEISQISNRRER